MSCPYYIDYTRMCVQFFPQVMERSNFSTCDSEDYHDCLAYRVIQKDFKCKYLKRCIEKTIKDTPQLVKYFIEDKTALKIFEEAVEKYCTSEPQHVHCAGFKLFEQGIQSPLGLLPDGKKIRLRDIVFKKEIVIE
jgi:hypothetical protein